MGAEGTASADSGPGLRVLITAASRQGATAGIARAIGETLAEEGFDVTVVPPEEVRSVDGYQAVIIGSAVYVGHWLDTARGLVDRCHDALADRPVWLFSSGPVGNSSGRLARAMGKDPEDLPALRSATRPQGHRMFAGKLDRKSLSRPQRAGLLVFPGLQGDFRDWTAIRQWARDIAQELAVIPADPPART